MKIIKNNQIKEQPGNNELLLSKEREIFENIYDEIFCKRDELSKNIDYGELVFIV